MYPASLGVKYHAPGDPSTCTPLSTRSVNNDLKGLHMKVNVCTDPPGLILPKSNAINRNHIACKDPFLFQENLNTVQEHLDAILSEKTLEISATSANSSAIKRIFQRQHSDIAQKEQLYLNHDIVSVDTPHTKSISSPTLRMEWEDFQDLEWVCMAHPQQNMLGVDELLVEHETLNNESVVRHLSNTSTPLSSIHEEHFDEGLWPSDTYNRSTPPVFENIIMPQQQQQIIYTEKCDDLVENELSIINDNNILVKGIINSTSANNSKSLDRINDDISESSIEYSNLDWNRVGLKSDNNNVMFSPPHSTFVYSNTASKSMYESRLEPSPLVSPVEISTTASTTTMPSTSSIVLPSSAHKLPTLHLDLIPQTISTAQKQVIDTPDVINTVLALKKDEFDLLAYINDDTVDSIISTDITEVLQIPLKKSLKRSYASSSTSSNCDESSSSKRSKQSSDITLPVARRGRPPKSRTTSISSEDTDGSKYRELRDKNNEASRRSRINRKLREANMEKEAHDLERENVRLTAQVRELDRLVSRMRDALLTTVLKKKNA